MHQKHTTNNNYFLDNPLPYVLNCNGGQDSSRIFIQITLFRGVAQLVARQFWELDVASSSLVTPTIEKGADFLVLLLFLYLQVIEDRTRTCEGAEAWPPFNTCVYGGQNTLIMYFSFG